MSNTDLLIRLIAKNPIFNGDLSVSAMISGLTNAKISLPTMRCCLKYSSLSSFATFRVMHAQSICSLLSSPLLCHTLRNKIWCHCSLIFTGFTAPCPMDRLIANITLCYSDPSVSAINTWLDYCKNIFAYNEKSIWLQSDIRSRHISLYISDIGDLHICSAPRS